MLGFLRTSLQVTPQGLESSTLWLYWSQSMLQFSQAAALGAALVGTLPQPLLRISAWHSPSGDYVQWFHLCNRSPVIGTLPINREV